MLRAPLLAGVAALALLAAGAQLALLLAPLDVAARAEQRDGASDRAEDDHEHEDDRGTTFHGRPRFPLARGG